MNIGLQGKVQNHPNHRSGACTRFLPASKLRSIFGRMEGHDGRKTPPASLWAQVLIQALFLWNCKKELICWMSGCLNIISSHADISIKAFVFSFCRQLCGAADWELKFWVVNWVPTNTNLTIPLNCQLSRIRQMLDIYNFLAKQKLEWQGLSINHLPSAPSIQGAKVWCPKKSSECKLQMDQ